MAADTLILALLGLPLLASALVLVLRDMPNLRDGQALLIGLITAACAIELYGRADGDTLFILSLAEGLDISFTPNHWANYLRWSPVCCGRWQRFTRSVICAARAKKPYALHVFLCHCHSCGDGYCAVGQFADAVRIL